MLLVIDCLLCSIAFSVLEHFLWLNFCAPSGRNLIVLLFSFASGICLIFLILLSAGKIFFSNTPANDSACFSLRKNFNNHQSRPNRTPLV